MPAFETRMSTPPIGDSGVSEGARHGLLVGDVADDAAHVVLSEGVAELVDRDVERFLVDIGENDAGALARGSRAAVALPMPPAPPVTNATRPARLLGFGMRCSFASSSSQYSMSKASCSCRPR